jgi:hypothetical protein
MARDKSQEKGLSCPATLRLVRHQLGPSRATRNWLPIELLGRRTGVSPQKCLYGLRIDKPVQVKAPGFRARRD